MKIENGIHWCDATTNAVTGCDKVSPGCKNCYAEAGTRARVLRAQGRETWGAKGERVPVNFEPVFRRLNKLCVCDNCHEAFPFERLFSDWETCGKPDVGATQPDHSCVGQLRRIRLFADSNSDWLDPKWPIETLARFLDAIRLAPNVDVLLLTKRIENFRQRLEAAQDYHFDHGDRNCTGWIQDWWKHSIAPKNVWLGVSVENQKCADERIPLLLNTPAAVRFLSVEPLLEKVDLRVPPPKHVKATGENGNLTITGLIDWVIAGGESGKNRRDCGVDAIESVVLQCANAGVPVFCKQDSHLLPGQKGRLSDNAWSFKEFPR